MKKFNKFLCIMIVLCLCISLSSVYAEDNDLAKTTEQLNDISTNICVDLKTSTSSVVIESNGYSEFVDVFATLDDNSVKNVNYDAIWETDNQDVAVAYEGRILAKGKGTAKIKV